MQPKRALVVALTLALAPVPGIAQSFLAGSHAYDSRDYATALRELRPLAEQGDVRAQNNLGVMYENGHGVPQDHAEAVRWFRAAAQQGNAIAQNNLGLMYRRGAGVPQDYVAAHMWLNIAAANGHSDAPVIRETLAFDLTPADVSEAQRRARVCLQSGYRTCD